METVEVPIEISSSNFFKTYSMRPESDADNNRKVKKSCHGMVAIFSEDSNKATCMNCTSEAKENSPRFAFETYCKSHAEALKRVMEYESDIFGLSQPDGRGNVWEDIITNCGTKKCKSYKDYVDNMHSRMEYLCFRRVIHFLFLKAGKSETLQILEYDKRLQEAVQIMSVNVSTMAQRMKKWREQKHVPNMLDVSDLIFYPKLRKVLPSVAWIRYGTRVEDPIEYRNQQENKEFENMKNSMYYALEART